MFIVTVPFFIPLYFSINCIDLSLHTCTCIISYKIIIQQPSTQLFVYLLSLEQFGHFHVPLYVPVHWNMMLYNH